MPYSDFIQWFVDSLTRNPFLIQYTSGLKIIDCIYLDTSNTEPITFPTKVEGLKELLQKVSKYPPDTTFHFDAWTFGYEEVWMALSRALQSPVRISYFETILPVAKALADPRRQIQNAPISIPPRRFYHGRVSLWSISCSRGTSLDWL